MGIQFNISLVMFHCFIMFALCKNSIPIDKKPAVFIFGDSLLDVGNNNYITTFAKANYLPYGIDFKGGPTGRFTNGRTTADIIGQEQGISFIPPYMAKTTTGPIILKGVNYASGAAGILNYTGYIFVGRINFDQQIDNFVNTRKEIIKMIGAPAALNLLKNAIFMIEFGSNDFLDNVLTPLISTRFLIPSISYVNMMISRLRLQITRIYNLGARKMVVSNVGPLGCMPIMRDYNSFSGGKCAPYPNKIAQLYNKKLKSLVEELRPKLEKSILIYADVYQLGADLIQNYHKYGFVNPNSSCCHLVGKFGGLVNCKGISDVCKDRSKYVFWDSFHLTDAANVHISRRMLYGDTNVITPMNIIQLMKA